MTRTEIASLLRVALAQWPNRFGKQESASLADLWNHGLADMPYELGRRAVFAVLSKATFFPTLGEIRDMALTLTDGQPISWADAWDMVRNTTRYQYGYEAREHIEALPPLVRETVRRLGWGYIKDSEQGGTVRAQFRDTYNDLAQAERELKRLPQALRDEIAAANERARLPEPKRESLAPPISANAAQQGKTARGLI